MTPDSIAGEVQQTGTTRAEVCVDPESTVSAEIGDIELISAELDLAAILQIQIAHRLAARHLPERLIIDGEIVHISDLAHQSCPVIKRHRSQTLGRSVDVTFHQTLVIQRNRGDILQITGERGSV